MIELVNIEKRFGNKRVLRNINLNLQEGKVYGLFGPNGVGKTTSIGKMANRIKKEGKSVIIAAADTFRAAAVEQVEIWAKRSGSKIVKRDEGTDPASVVFEAIQELKKDNADVLICDTAGRLHNKTNLMKELEKINKILENIDRAMKFNPTLKTGFVDRILNL